jgi:hypothetical protein
MYGIKIYSLKVFVHMGCCSSQGKVSAGNSKAVRPVYGRRKSMILSTRVLVSRSHRSMVTVFDYLELTELMKVSLSCR